MAQALDPVSPPPASAARYTGTRKRLTVYVLALAAFYLCWSTYLSMSQSWHVLADKWPIAVAMALGSFVAGSTPMGGGTVGFPFLVLGFDFPVSVGRDFSFAIQSVGMVSATLYLLAVRRPLDWAFLRPALIGASMGTPLGLVQFAPNVPTVVIKLAFASLCASFGVLHLVKSRSLVEDARGTGAGPFSRAHAGYAMGFFGAGLVSSITGVGVDMLAYIVLVLLFRSDLRIAIPTSVVLMAFTSLVGTATQITLGELDQGVRDLWLAAAPVVAIGAPLGAVVVERLNRHAALRFVSLLCLGQFVWTLHHEAESLGSAGVSIALVTMAVTLGLFEHLYRLGRQTSVPRTQS